VEFRVHCQFALEQGECGLQFLKAVDNARELFHGGLSNPSLGDALPAPAATPISTGFWGDPAQFLAGMTF
jgi:hypothetical protein